MLNHGIKLADGTMFEGMAGSSKDRVELTMTNEVLAEHLLDLMDSKKTKWIGFYFNKLIAEYRNCEFLNIQRDSVTGNANVWYEVQKGDETIYGNEENDRNREDGGNEEEGNSSAQNESSPEETGSEEDAPA